MKPTSAQLQQFYRQVFESPAGKQVLEDLERIINQTRITSDSPNPYSAVYVVAQQQLVRRIRNMCKERNVANDNDKEHLV
jgi:ferredoxin-NADP reductase